MSQSSSRAACRSCSPDEDGMGKSTRTESGGNARPGESARAKIHEWLARSQDTASFKGPSPGTHGKTRKGFAGAVYRFSGGSLALGWAGARRASAPVSRGSFAQRWHKVRTVLELLDPYGRECALPWCLRAMQRSACGN